MHSAEIFIGIIIGIVFSIPLGPVGVIVMKRTLDFGARAGIISGLAIAIIDTAAALLFLVGLHNSAPYFRHIPQWIRICGNAIIFIYGLRMVLASAYEPVEENLPWHKHFFSAAGLALTSPSTYIAFGAMGLILSPLISKPLFTRIEVGIGFFIGAFIWWSVLALITVTHRDKYIGPQKLQRIVGIIIMCLALINMLAHHHAGTLFSFVPHLIQ